MAAKRKKALTEAKQREIQQIAFAAGEKYAQDGGDKDHTFKLLVNRLAYKYRVKASVIKLLARPSFLAGSSEENS